MKIINKHIVVVLSLLMAVSFMSCKTKDNKVVKKQENNTTINEPVIGDSPILRPVFTLDNRKLEAGTAFAVSIDEQKPPIFLTALHLFGPNGGLDLEISSSELPSRVKKAEFYDAFNEEKRGEASKTALIPIAKINVGVDKDIAAFISDEKLKVTPFKLSDNLPKKGEAVWLAASVYEGAPKNQKLHKAIVLEASDSLLMYKYENNNLNLQATSGAAVLNSEGRVVGLNIGSMREDNKLVGGANPCTNVKKLLNESLKK